MQPIDLSAVVVAVLRLSKASHRPPARQDVVDALDVEVVGQEVADTVRADMIEVAWGVILRVWWLKRCVPEWASVPRKWGRGKAAGKTALSP